MSNDCLAPPFVMQSFGVNWRVSKDTDLLFKYSAVPIYCGALKISRAVCM